MFFWQETAALDSVQDTVTYRSLVAEKANPAWIQAVTRRTQNRGTLGVQMPPLGTEEIDSDGLAPVHAWMERLDEAFVVKPPSGGACDGASLDDVYDLFIERGCQTSFCHLTPQGGFVFQNKEELRDALISVPAAGEPCKDTGLLRVSPNDPDASLLMMKLQGGPPCGKAMPQMTAFSENELLIVRRWIGGCIDGVLPN